MKWNGSQRALLALITVAVLGGGPALEAKDKKQDKHDKNRAKEEKKQQHQEVKEERRDDARDRSEERQSDDRRRIEGRLSAARQRELIRLQQARIQQYDGRLRQQQRLAEQRATVLQQQNRMAHYRFQQEYLARLRQQQASLAAARTYNYDSDPYFYTAPTYRYSRAGRTHETNEYGARLLRQAVNNGYEEGVRAGQADRQDNYRRGYRDSYAYQDANYGYTGMYVEPGDYNHYFREGFQRGYEDGYNSRSQYGGNANGTLGILANVLSAILNLQALR